MSLGEWRAVELSDVATFGSGTTPARARQSDFYDHGTVPWVKTLDLNNGAIVSTDESVTKLAVDKTNLRVHPTGSVLVAMYGGFAQIGRTGVLRVPAATNQAITVVLPDRKLLSSDFLLHLLNYKVGHWRSVASSSRKDPNITKNDVKSFPFALPPLTEQEAVAGALNDVSDLLTSLERAIAKKRGIKQGLMQELLTGRTRLQSFERDWTASTLGAVVKTVGGGTPPRSVAAYWGGSIPWATVKDISTFAPTRTQEYITLAGVRASATRVVRAGTPVLAARMLVGKAVRFQVDVAINQDLKALLTSTAVDDSFLCHWFDANGGLLAASASGSTVAGTSTAQIKAMPIDLPSVDEQRAIASVLDTADAEIEALERRLEATRAIKQGMMQELLTGRTRLGGEGAA
jgi:type I restriction enzyme S subunit